MVDGALETYVYDAWNPYSTIANDVALDFEEGVLVRRWLHSTSVDEPLAFEAYTGTTAPGSGGAREMYADRLGSILAVVDAATGTVLGEAAYDSFGAPTVTGTMPRYGYTGREHDDTGLIYYRARHFDPITGQFLQRDPIGFAAGDLNLYAYVWNDPYNWTDPSGLMPAGNATMTAGSAGMARGAVAAVSRGIGALMQALQRQLTQLALKEILNMAQNAGDDDAGAGAGAGSGSGSAGGSGGDEDPEGDDDRPDVEFGNPNDKNQQHHIDKHFEGRTDVTREEAEKAVRQAIDEALSNGELSETGQGLRGRVDVNGVTVEYRAHNTGGRVNVGTMFAI